jgi:hypothetical protein
MWPAARASLQPWADQGIQFPSLLGCRAEMDARPADLEPLMTEREIPSWLKYYEEEQLSAGQVRWAADYLGPRYNIAAALWRVHS